jgi:multidrug efflux pump subunit AcrA (membrane-fusion protein)
MECRPRLLPLLFTAAILCAGPQAASAQGRVIRVTTAQPERATVELTEWSVGLIETRTSSQVAAEVPGEIVRVLVDEGQGVAAGAVLAEIDGSEYALERAREQAEVGRLSALLRKQEGDLERARKLYAENLIAEDQLDGLAAELDALRQQWAGAQAKLESTERRVAKTQLLAPVERSGCRFPNTGRLSSPPACRCACARRRRGTAW